MAANYTILGQYPDVTTSGDLKVTQVQVIQAQTKPHGVYFETRLPRNVATTANITAQVNGFAIVYELLFEIPGVADVSWTQEPTPAGELEDHVILYVTSTSGESQGQLDVPYSQFAQELIAPKVAKLVAGLDATEAA